jgi:hypothetical protein
MIKINFEHKILKIIEVILIYIALIHNNLCDDIQMQSY